MQPQQAHSAIIIGAGNEFIVAGVVGCSGEQVVVVVIAAHWQISPADVPKLKRLVMARHEITLLIGVIVHPQDLISALLACLNQEFLTKSAQCYLFDFLSHTWISLRFVA